MRIDLKDVLKGERDYEGAYDPSMWVREDEFDPIVRLEGPIQVQLHIEPVGVRFFLKGNLSGTLVLRCDRCLEEFLSPINQSFELVLRRSPKELVLEKELTKEELLEEFFEGDEIDVDPLVREQIYLFLPMKCLCKADCKGLCPNCGANLNIEHCGCAEKLGHPAFLKLKKLIG